MLTWHVANPGSTAVMVLRLALAALPLVACQGSIEDPSGSGRVAAHGGGPGLIDDHPQASCSPGDPPTTTRLARLTHKQYANSIAALTGVIIAAAAGPAPQAPQLPASGMDLKVTADFLADQHQAGFDRGLDLQVGEVLARSYRDAAEKVADAVVTTPAAYARVVGCDPALGDACARGFIADFGRRSFRRPLTDLEQTSYFTLFKRGPALVDTGDDFQRGVRIVLEALLQSPKFLYRVELSAGDAGARVALNGYEVASRLSYALANTTPDALLLQAAGDDRLKTADDVAAQATRLLSDSAAARETVRDFHHQWLDLDVYPNKLAKDAKLYPSVTPALAPVLQSEVERFVDAVTFDRKRGLASLFTAPFSFVNKTTAPIYGVAGSFDDTLKEVPLDPTQRAGIVTQLGFLATRAFSTTSSPIHRGVFIQRRILCATIPDPPPNIPALPAVDGTQIRTTRQQVDQHTAPEPCASCHHTLINPVGFGLENFDAIGRYRTQENSVTIDASGDLAGTVADARFGSGVTLARALAEAPEARSCYARNLFRYTLGRAEGSGDTCALDALADKLKDDDYTAVDLMTDLTRTRAFLYRTAEAP
jgi:hypothetical protein